MTQAAVVSAWPTTVGQVSDPTTSTQPKVMLIDGHSMAYRAFYALPAENFSTASGQHTNAVYGFTSMLINVLRDEQPTHVVVAFDVSRATFRSEQYSDYKATRAKSPDEFAGQVSLIQEVLDALNVVHVQLDGYEADDIIATLTDQADQRGWASVIVTGDRDTYQLVDDNTTVLYPVRGVSELSRMTPAIFSAMSWGQDCSMTPNSSPPSRARASSSRTRDCMSFESWRSSSSPAAWPALSLTCLK